MTRGFVRNGIGAKNAAGKRRRRRLVAALVGVLFLTVAAMLAFVIIEARQASRDVSEARIHETVDWVREQFRALFEPANQQLLLLREWGQSGLLPIGEPSGINGLVVPLLSKTPQISGVILASSDGSEYFLTRDDTGWLARSVPPGAPGEVAWTAWSGDPAGSEPERRWTEKLDYDPRTRPWFQAAMATEPGSPPVWTEPYVFHTAGVPGVTGAVRWRLESGGETRDFVAAIDVFLQEILDEIAAIEVSDNGVAFLFSGDGRVCRPSFLENVDVKSLPDLFEPVAVCGRDEVRAAVGVWQDHQKLAQSAVSFRVGKEAWWAGFTPIEAGGDIWIAVVVPERDLVGMIGRRRTLFLTLGGILGMGVLGIAFFGMRLGKGGEALVPAMEGADGLQEMLPELLRRGEGTQVEFKSTMRHNLKTGQHGKEIELAWLKGVVAFLNTDGGIILLGVGDDGEVLGIGPDGFGNDDRCRLHFRNLVKQHIGLDFSKYIDFEIITLDGKKIAVILCRPSPDPAFLRANGKESFYIRSGPSSVELPVSQVLHYLKNRGKRRG